MNDIFIMYYEYKTRRPHIHNSLFITTSNQNYISIRLRKFLTKIIMWCAQIFKYKPFLGFVFRWQSSCQKF